MLRYSRSSLLKLRFWWKCSELTETCQITRQVKQQIKPLDPMKWNALKSVGLLKRFRGVRRRQTVPSIFQIQPRITARMDFENFNFTEARLVKFQNLIYIHLGTTSISTPTNNVAEQCYYDQDNQPIQVHFSNQTRYPSLEITQPKQINYSNLINIKKQEKSQLSSKVRFGLWNARSISKKSAAVCDIIQTNRLDVFALTETWLTNDANNNSLSEIMQNLKDFSIFQIPRISSKGGGVALLLRKAFLINVHSSYKPKTFELLDASLKFKESTFRMVVVYRPPPSRKNKLTSNAFLDEFSQYMESTIIAK